MLPQITANRRLTLLDTISASATLLLLAVAPSRPPLSCEPGGPLYLRHFVAQHIVRRASALRVKHSVHDLFKLVLYHSTPPCSIMLRTLNSRTDHYFHLSLSRTIIFLTSHVFTSTTMPTMPLMPQILHTSSPASLAISFSTNSIARPHRHHNIALSLTHAPLKCLNSIPYVVLRRNLFALRERNLHSSHSFLHRIL